MIRAGAFLLTWLVCVLTCCPTVCYDDTGEFCVAAIELGVPHPPGYPLYVLLMAIARHFPAGSIAFRLNLLAGLWAGCAAVALAALWRNYRRGPEIAGSIAGVAAVLAAGPWSQATTAKGGVYLLNAALAAGVLWTGRAPWGRGSRAAASGLLTGLALANHWMTAAAILPAFAVQLAERGEDSARRRVATGVLGLALGVSVYVILPILASRQPFLNWSSAETARGFVFSVARTQYLGSAVGETSAPVGERIAAIGAALSGSAPLVLLIPFAVFGLWSLGKESPNAALATGSCLAALAAGLVRYGPLRAGAPWYFEIFAITGTVLAGWLAIAGLAAAAGSVGARLRRGREIAAAAAVVAAAAGLAMFAGPGRWHACDRSREYLTWDLAVNLDAQTAGRGILFANSDVVVFGNWYYWLVEGRRRGAVVVPAPLLPMPWVARGFAHMIGGLRAPLPLPTAGAEAIPSLMRAWDSGNRSRFAIYTFMSDAARAAWPEGSRRGAPPPSRLVEHGWVYQVAGGAAARSLVPEPVGARGMRLRGWEDGEMDREPRKEATFQPLAMSGLLTMSDAAVALAGQPGRGGLPRRLLAWARGVARSGEDRGRVESGMGHLAAREGRWADAAASFERSADLWPSPPTLMNLVVAQLRLGRQKRAVATAKRLVRDAPQSEEGRAAAALLGRLERQGGVGR